jgi:hypothetical protein
MVLNEADKVFLGTQEVSRIYLGNNLIWELSSGEFMFSDTDPFDVSGINEYLENLVFKIF